MNRVALDEADSYVQPAKGLSFWDLCAPECIVRAMGGLCTDFDQKRLSYDKQANDGSTKLPAFYIGKTLQYHSQILRRFKSHL